MTDDPINREDEDFWLKKAEQIGPNEWIRRTSNGDGATIGLIDIHRNRDGKLCVGSVHFDVPEARAYGSGPFWTVSSLDPLDLSPSLLCTVCGHHGFIRQGKWVGV